MSESLSLEHVLYEIRRQTAGRETDLSETEAIHEFCQAFQQERNFSKHTSRALFKQLLQMLKSRCLSDDWSVGVFSEGAGHALLMTIRLLLRDEQLQRLFMGGQSPIPVLSDTLSQLTHLHVTMVTTDTATLDLLKELTNIFQKISHSPCYHGDLIGSGVHLTLCQLLECRDIGPLQCALCALINLCKCPSSCETLCSTLTLPHTLLHIITTYDIATRRLATDLLLLLSRQSLFRDQIQDIDGLSVCIKLLHSEDHHILHHIVCVIERLAESSQLQEDIRLLGGIPILLNILTKQTLTNTLSLEAREKVLALKAACCSTITQLVLNDSNAQLIVQLNGVYLVAIHILPLAKDIKADQRLKFNLQKHALRALRYLFSVERNRSLFKKLFPPRLFEMFIDVGHYTRNHSAYDSLTHTITNLPEAEREVIQANIESTNQNKAPIFTIGGYAVLELLGSGAFGSVYKVRKSHSDTFLALKEIRSTHPSLGKTLTERSNALGRLLNEVNIMREQLRHTNVVHYHKCFQEGGHLYIVMQLLEGASLAEHIKSLQEKCLTFSEQRLWRVFSQLVLALRYIHKEKRIIHRDLSPANIMLGDGDKLTITDFGLAKQKQREFSVMESVVGTMLYWCPELVQSEPYNEKADIWAAGCVLYQMATLHPPFHSPNMLALAKKIAEVDYPPIPDGSYSSLVSEVIGRCLTADPRQRVDSVQLGSMLAEVLMCQMDQLSLSNESLEKRLAKEKHRTIKHLNKAMLSEQKYQQLLSSSESYYGNHQSNARRRLSSSFASIRGNHISTSIPDDSEAKQTPDPSQTTPAPTAKPLVAREISPADSEVDSLQKISDSVFMESVTEETHHDVSYPSNTEHQLDTNISSQLSRMRMSRINPLTSRVRSQSAVIVGGRGVEPLSLVPNQHSSLSGRASEQSLNGPLSPLATRQMSRTASVSSILSISPRHLREISDPITQLLSHLHKLIFLTQLPPSPTHTPARRLLVETYKRNLFDQSSNLADLKTELYKLSNGSSDTVISLVGTVGLQSRVISRALSELSVCGEGGVGVEVCWGGGNKELVTYEQLQAIIDSLVIEHHYYTNTD